jgi:hypothetical protein
MSYYDEATGTTYYGDQMVLNITEYDRDGDLDSNIFIVFDHDDELLYVYGSRGEKGRLRYEKTFCCASELYKFIKILVHNHTISYAVHYVNGLTNYDDYDTLKAKCTKHNEVVAYDNANIYHADLKKYVNAFLL